MDELKAQAEALGIDVDGRWGEERLKAEIEKALAARQPADLVEEPEEVIDPEPEEPEAPAEPEPEPEQAAASALTVTNLRPNPMKALGLASYGKREFTEAELTNPRLMAKIKRGQELGILKVE